MYDDEAASALARALAHPVRIRILRLLAAQSECSGSDLFSDFPLAQSTVSEHIRVLKDAGLVSSHSVGTHMVYCISSGALEPLWGLLGTLRQDAPTCTSSEGEVTND